MSQLEIKGMYIMISSGDVKSSLPKNCSMWIDAILEARIHLLCMKDGRMTRIISFYKISQKEH